MSQLNIIRAWKDPEYRATLSPAQLASLPSHPAGIIELTNDELDDVTGAGRPRTFRRTWCGSCNLFTLQCCGRVGCSRLAEVVILSGVGVLDADDTVSSEEHANMLNTIEDWHNDPSLNADQIDRINTMTANLEGQVSAEEWQGLMDTVNDINQTGTISDEQLLNLVDYADIED